MKRGSQGRRPRCKRCISKSNSKTSTVTIRIENQELAKHGLRKCSKCAEVKDPEDFKLTSNGRNSVCKLCTSTTGGTYAARNEENRRLARDGKRRCPRCLEIKALSDYNRTRKGGDAVQSWCKVCHRDSQGFSERPHADLIELNRTMIPEERKYCLVCREIKDYEEFYKYKGIGGRHPWCKLCIGRKARMEKYGLTFEEVLAAEAVTHCEVCLVELNSGEKGTERHFDHDHDSGGFCGVLCERCNVALGMLRNDPDSLQRMADYARRTRKPA